MVTDAGWRALKDSLYGLLIRRARQLPQVTLGDEADQLLLSHVSRIQWSPQEGAGPLGALYDVGYDLGRHVYAKRVLHDSLAYMVQRLGHELQASGIGTLKAEEVFHRSARITYAAGQSAARGTPEVFASVVAGILHGTAEEVFNSQVRIAIRDPHTFDLRLLEGRDINQEGAHGKSS